MYHWLVGIISWLMLTALFAWGCYLLLSAIAESHYFKGMAFAVYALGI